jgi:PHD/YefM family antitoxin component YafN of YafNO toxin-antitoxin module
VVDSEDPLAEGVSASFSAPDGSLSFVTSEMKVVINDGANPVVIRKKGSPGNIVLIGFDYYSSNLDADRVLGNAVALEITMTVEVEPSIGSPGDEIAVWGEDASSNGTVSVFWDGAFAGSTVADNLGKYTYLLTVPDDAYVGVHEIMVVDEATAKYATVAFKVLLLALTPSEGPVGTKVLVEGFGFSPSVQVSVAFNDMLLGYAATDDEGNFAFTFNIPVSADGAQTVKAFDSDGNFADAVFMVVDVTPLIVQVDVGSLYFAGEIAEFYVPTVFRGRAVNASLTSVSLYSPNGAVEPLSADWVATGLYKVSYTVVDNATGTYALVVAANYSVGSVRAEGTSFKCFLISSAFSLMSQRVLAIEDGVALIQADTRFVRLNLTAMNSKLEDIFLRVVSINSTVATVQTRIGLVEATVVSIDGNVADIVVPELGEIKADVSGLKGIQTSFPILQYVTLIVAIVAAISSVLSMAMLKRRKPPEPKQPETVAAPQAPALPAPSSPS